MATSALATAFVNIVPGTVELERYLKGELGTQAEAAGVLAGKNLANGLTSSLTGVGNKLAGVGQSMSLAITAPLAMIGYQGIKTAADFGVTMASMQVNSGATSDKMEELRKLAIKMGQDTVFSAGEAADAMLELSKGGMTPAAIQGGALASTMNLAATEGMGLADAATIIVQTMNSFGLSAADTAGAVDLLAAGAVASTASIGDLAAGMKYVGSTAHALKVPLSDTVTALAAMNNAGLDSTTAGTSLNQFLLRLIPTTRKAAEEAAALHVNFVGANGSLKPMSEIVKELADTYGGMGDAARTASLKTIFGVEGMRTAQILLAQGTPGWDSLSASVNKTGIAADLSNARMSGLAGAIETMKGSIDTAILAVGDRMTPAITTLTSNITGLVNWFAALSPEVQSQIVNFGMFLAVLGPTILVIGKLFVGISSIITGFSQMTTLAVSAAGGIANFTTGLFNASAGSSAFATPMMKLGGFLREAAIGFGQLIVQMGQYVAAQAVVFATWVRDTAAKVANTVATVALSVAQKAAAAGQWLLNIAMDANPIGLLIIAIAALVAGLVYFFTQTEIGRKAWSVFTDFMDTTIHNIGAWFANVWRGIVTGWNNVLNWFRDLPTQIKNFMNGAGTWLVDAGKNIIEGLINGATSMGNAVSKWVSNLGNSIMNGFKSILGIHSPSVVFNDFGVNIGQGLANGIESQINPVTGVVERLGKAISDQMDTVVTGVNGQLVNITAMTDQVNNAYQGFRDAGIGQNTAMKLAGGGQALQKQLDAALGQVSFTNAVTGMSTVIGGQSDMTPQFYDRVIAPLLASGYKQTGGTTVAAPAGSTAGTINYYAAPNSSIDSEAALIKAMRTAKVIGA